MDRAPAGQDVGRVVIGMDRHKRSVTIEVMAGDEAVLGGGRFATTAEGYRAMRRYVGWVAAAGVGH
jgi:transposase